MPELVDGELAIALDTQPADWSALLDRAIHASCAQQEAEDGLTGPERVDAAVYADRGGDAPAERIVICDRRDDTEDGHP